MDHADGSADGAATGKKPMSKNMANEYCRCNMPMIWLKHKTTGKANPIDLKPVANGNLLIDEERRLYRLATTDEIAKAKRIGKPLYISHFSTCPFAKEFRRKTT